MPVSSEHDRQQARSTPHSRRASFGSLHSDNALAPVSRSQTSNLVGKNLVGVVSRKFAQQMRRDPTHPAQKSA